MSDFTLKIQYMIDQLIGLLPPELLVFLPSLEALLQHPSGRYVFVSLLLVIVLLALWISAWLVQALIGGGGAKVPRDHNVKLESESRLSPEHKPTDVNNTEISKHAIKVDVSGDVAALAAIEQEMLAVRQLFCDGHIVKDVYVSETRRLYNKAKMLKT